MLTKSQKTKQRVLEAALSLLESGEPGKVRMADIAKQADITRQALYLHYPNRAELLIATTRYLDEVNGIDDLLRPSREAKTGVERLDHFIDVWGNYMPKVYGIVRALIRVYDTDEAAAAAWDDRKTAVRHGCAAITRTLKQDGLLVPKQQDATDILTMLLSLQNWEQLTQEDGWSQSKYLKQIKHISKLSLIGRGVD